MADHATESALNLVTEQLEKMRHDTCDVMVWLLLQLQRQFGPVRSWKRDVKRAFKRVPVRVQHHDLAGSVWRVGTRTTSPSTLACHSELQVQEQAGTG